MVILERTTQPSRGNVFADLGVSQPAVALVKAELARQIAGIVRERQLTQVAAAKVLGVDQAKVSALLRGQLAGFSTERLFRFLNALDHDIEIVVKKKARSRKRAGVAVVMD
ncbi:MAG: XRE family transcriptional regulator [Phycisphaerales bacterium]|nr:XRE family transcriptional regulator [Phycisphaerales bacterium]